MAKTQPDTFSVSFEHPFLVDGKWKTAERLAKGDVLMRANGAGMAIEFVTKITSDDEISVFNITVNDNHTYCVTEQGMVVHNK
jgi:hypothetical protein